jgi:hypothetical protein
MKITKYLSYFSFGLNLILLFFLVFEKQLIVPIWLNPIGRLHPIMLHLPIGALTILLFFFLFKKHFEDKSFRTFFEIILVFLSLTSALSAFVGLLLAQENGYDPTALFWHKWTGFTFSALSYLALEFKNKIQNIKTLQIITLSFLSVFMLWAGHLGGEVTHGENFVFSGMSNDKKLDSERKTAFSQHIEPILDAKCRSCHNDKKTKGDLNMTSIEKMLKGGKNGPLWFALDTLKSHILLRTKLPLEEKKHMPPKGKPQLTSTEIFLIKTWIAEGADYKSTTNQLPAQSYFKKLSSPKLAEVKEYKFSSPSESALEKLNSPYCSVIPLAYESPAMQASFYVSSKFDLKALQNLQDIKEQLVRLNLSKMPVNDEIFKTIGNFENLEYLNLNQTNIEGKGIENLLKCKKLEELAISNTKITDKEIEKLIKHPSLKKVFVWSTAITNIQAEKYQKINPKLKFELGFDATKVEKLKLNPPVTTNEKFVIEANEKVAFKHTLKNVEIRYTLDGTPPDSLKSNLYTQPISLNTFTNIKLLATKEGWLSSKEVEYNFFKSGIRAQSAILNLKPDVKYPGNGGNSLIDLKQGDMSNQKEPNWLGFRENNFESTISFKPNQVFKEVTISYLQKDNGYIMPPEWIEIWISKDKKPFKLLKKIKPSPLTKPEKSTIKAINVALVNQSFDSMKIIAKPVAKLPNWHRGKGEKGWFFIDEVYFN